MKTLQKMILGLLITASASAFCNEEPKPEVKNKYDYWAIGAGLPTLLSVKIGHREQTDHNGFEYGMGVTPLIVVNELHVFASYLYYPKPNLKGQTYFGLGLKAGGIMDQIYGMVYGYAAPGVLIGREYQTKSNNQHFVQAAFGAGGITTFGSGFFPSVSLTFGFGF